MLRDDLINPATQEIHSEGRSRREIQRDIKTKERAIETLSSRYQRRGLSQETLRQCLYSIGDNHAFLRVNRDPCERMIKYLQDHFHPTQAKDPKNSLAIRSGKGGARLSHDHSKQYAYVIQSLTLWREILHGKVTHPKHLHSFKYLSLCSQTCSIYGLLPKKICSPTPFRTAYETPVRVLTAFNPHLKPPDSCTLFSTKPKKVLAHG